MLFLLLFILALTHFLGIEALARGRGAYPGLWGSIGVLAFCGSLFVAPYFGLAPGAQFVLAWVLLGVVAFVVRFVVGARKPQPDGMWSCPNCHMVNEASYVVCQACARPWSK
jgi:hypothetical protein